MNIETIKKLIISDIRADNKIGLLFLKEYIDKYGIKDLSPEESDDYEGYRYLIALKVANFTDEDRRNNRGNMSVDRYQGIKTKDFSLNLGGWYVVYSQRGTNFYNSILTDCDNIEDLTNE